MSVNANGLSVVSAKKLLEGRVAFIRDVDERGISLVVDGKYYDVYFSFNQLQPAVNVGKDEEETE